MKRAKYKKESFIGDDNDDDNWIIDYCDCQDPRKTTFAEVKAKCPEFKSGCPYTKVVPQLKGLQGKCPAFKQAGCPFKDMSGKCVDNTIKKAQL